MLLNSTVLATTSSAQQLFESVASVQAASHLPGLLAGEIGANKAARTQGSFRPTNHLTSNYSKQQVDSIVEAATGEPRIARQQLKPREVSYETQTLLLQSHRKDDHQAMISKSAEGYYVFDNITLKVSCVTKSNSTGAPPTEA